MGESLCMGLIRFSASIPTPSPSRHDLIGHHSLIGIDGDVLDGDLLLAPPAVPIQRLGEHSNGAGRLVGECEVFGSGLPGLLVHPGAPTHLEGAFVGRDHLGGEHGLDGIGGRERHLAGDDGLGSGGALLRSEAPWDGGEGC
jgi:hypothetical protein